MVFMPSAYFFKCRMELTRLVDVCVDTSRRAGEFTAQGHALTPVLDRRRCYRASCP